MIDLHSDTIYALWKNNSEESIENNTLHINKAKLLRASSHGQCFALFTPMQDLLPESHRGKTPWQILTELHNRFVYEMEKASIPILRSARELDEPFLHAILTIEEGGAIEGDISRISMLKDWSVKIFGLTWNWENELGYPNSNDMEIMSSGLKKKGIEAVEECNRLGILVDVSHLSDGGLRDVVRYSKLPVVATHSNSRSITAVSRNLTDEELCMIASTGGVVGLNLCPAFLHDEKARNAEDAVSRVEDMVRHVMHIYNTAGEDILAIGTDFDGIEGNLEIPSPDKLFILQEALLKAGMKSSVVDKMWEDNARRVFLAAEEEM